MEPNDKHLLVKSFQRWGKKLLGHAIEGAVKYGILCSSTKFSDGVKG